MKGFNVLFRRVVYLTKNPGLGLYKVSLKVTGKCLFFSISDF
jgi:hypothetical protein